MELAIAVTIVVVVSVAVAYLIGVIIDRSVEV